MTYRDKRDAIGWPKTIEEAEEGAEQAIKFCSYDLTKSAADKAVGSWMPHLCITLEAREAQIKLQQNEIERLKDLLRTAKAWPAATKAEGWYRKATEALL